MFVIECLKALLLATPRDQYRLLLPYSGPRDFQLNDSLASLKVDQALLIHNWGDKIGNGVDEPYYANMLAVVEAKVDNSPKVSSKSS
ncbi:hypothetical protein GGI16_007102, partial [Coemansia sp. S142-1]